MHLRLEPHRRIAEQQFVDRGRSAAHERPFGRIHLVGHPRVVAARALHADHVPVRHDLDILSPGDRRQHARAARRAIRRRVALDLEPDADPVRPHAAAGEAPPPRHLPAARHGTRLLRRIKPAGEDLVRPGCIDDLLRLDRQAGHVGIGRPERRDPGGGAIDHGNPLDDAQEIRRRHRLAAEAPRCAAAVDPGQFHHLDDVAGHVGQPVELVAAALDLGRSASSATGAAMLALRTAAFGCKAARSSMRDIPVSAPCVIVCAGSRAGLPATPI